MNFETMRKRMVEEQIVSRGITSEKIIEAFLNVPRENFVPENMRRFAYDDYPLSIGYGQTISQPYIVALMMQALNPSPGDRVLEVGTGSGYQAVLLAHIGCRVYSVEKRKILADKANKVFESMGYDIKVKVGDGTLGWPEHSPFDSIIVTAGGPVIPESLFFQLREGGKMVIPVGEVFGQELMLVTKKKGRMKTRSLGGCQFVKLEGKEGWKESE